MKPEYNDAIDFFLNAMQDDKDFDPNNSIGKFKETYKNQESSVYTNTWDYVFLLAELIHTNYLKQSRDLQYTINYLLGGGYRFGATKPLQSLPLTKENLYLRIGMYLAYKKVQNTKEIQEIVRLVNMGYLE